MPSIEDHRSASFVKALLIAESGGGKTGALAALAEAGYKLWIVDCDNNLGVLRDLAKGKPWAKNIQFETCTDKLKNTGGQVRADGAPSGFNTALKLLTDWPGKGPLETWTADDILIVDTLTTLGTMAMRKILHLVGREGKAELQDWGAAMNLIEGTVQLLASPAVNCHVLLLSHINFTEDHKGAITKGYPSALGNKLSPKIPIYFENVWLIKSSGSGATKKRTILTRGDAMVEGKAPVSIPAEVPQATGLADIFRSLTGRIRV